MDRIIEGRPSGSAWLTVEQAQKILGEELVIPENWLISEIRRRNKLCSSADGFNGFIPIRAEELEKYGGGNFILIPGRQISIADFFLFGLHDLGLTIEDSWYNEFSFAKKEKVYPCWYLARKSIIPNSKGKNYSEMEAMLKDREQVPRACELFYAIVIYFLYSEGGKILRRTPAICCDEIGDEKKHPWVGFFPPDSRLDIRYYSAENEPSGDRGVGLAPILRLFP